MNERIRELAKEAGAGEWGDSIVPAMMDIEKFAELIVRECCGEVLCQLYDYSPSLNEQYNAGHEAGLKLAVGKIKQHFGVE